MNIILKKMSVVKMEAGRNVIMPFLFIEDESQEDGKIQRLLTVYLQFDRDGLSGHKPVQIHNYGSADHVEIFKDDTKIKTFMPLVKAFKNRDDDKVVSCDFEGGKLWGWFPKDYTV